MPIRIALVLISIITATSFCQHKQAIDYKEHKVAVSTPDSGYWRFPVSIVDRNTAEMLSFNPVQGELANIHYRATRNGWVRLRIVDYQDTNLVYRILQDWTELDYGPQDIKWDGRDECGNLVNPKRAMVLFDGEAAQYFYHAPNTERSYKISLNLVEDNRITIDISSGPDTIQALGIRYFDDFRLLTQDSIALDARHTSYQLNQPLSSKIFRAVAVDANGNYGSCSISID